MANEGDVLTIVDGHQAFAAPAAGGGTPTLAEVVAESPTVPADATTTIAEGANGAAGVSGGGIRMAAGSGNGGIADTAPQLQLSGMGSGGDGGGVSVFAGSGLAGQAGGDINLTSGGGDGGNGGATLTVKGGSAAGAVQGIILTGLPTSDPGVAGQLWNSTGTVKISAG